MIKITINDSEVKILKNILKKEFFEKDNSSIFKKLLNKKEIIKCDNVSSNRNTASYLEVYTDSKIDMSQLENKVVLVVGLGGIGCEIITHLVGNGIKGKDFRIVFEGAQNITTDKKWHASEFNKRIQNNVVCIQFDQKLLTCIQAL